MGFVVFFFKQKTAYEMRISDWSSDVCSSDLIEQLARSRSLGQDARSQTRDADPQGASMETILAQWRRERPDIDPSPMAVVGDVWRTSERLRQGVGANLSGSGLDLAGFDVLLTLRRQGRGGSLSPSLLAREMMLSTSAMTNRLDRLEQRGLIERTTDPDDRRGLRIVLRSEEHTSELQSLMRISYAVFCFKKKTKIHQKKQ